MRKIWRGTQIWLVRELEALVGDAAVGGEEDLEAVGADGEQRDAALTVAQHARRMSAVILEPLPAALDDQPVEARLGPQAVDRHAEALHAHAHTPSVLVEQRSRERQHSAAAFTQRSFASPPPRVI